MKPTDLGATMITIIDRTNMAQRAAELEEAFRFRHSIFVDGMGWEQIRRTDGLERDQFDTEHAVHFLLCEKGKLVGYQRLLPTTRPYLLTEVYPYLCDGEAPHDPFVFEWTRLAVLPNLRGDGDGLGSAGAELVLAMVEWCIARGIRAVILEMAPPQLVKLAQCHFMAYPLGVAHPVDGRLAMAVVAHFDHRTVAKLREFAGLVPARVPEPAI